MARFRHNHLTRFILVAFILGGLLGLVLNQLGIESWTHEWLTEGLLKLGGQIFLNLLKFLIVPVVLFSLSCGVANLDNLRDFGRIAGKTIFIFLGSTAAAVLIAILVSNFIRPGEGFQLPGDGSIPLGQSAPSLLDSLIHSIPANPFQALANAEMLQVIFLAIVLGLAFTASGQPGRNMLGIFQNLNAVTMTIVSGVMWFSPVGVFCLIGRVLAVQGPEAFGPLVSYVMTVLIVLGIFMALCYSILLASLGRVSPIWFFKNFKEPMLFAFSTSSSSATIPVTLESADRRLGIDNMVASFVIPFGAAINKNGTAIMQGVATSFIAQAAGVNLGVDGIITVVVTTTIASVSTAGVPSVGLVTLAMVLKSVNLPLEGIGVVLAVDRLLDMCRTVVNVSGHAVTALIVARSEKLLRVEKISS